MPQFQNLLLFYSGILLLPGLVLGGCTCSEIYPFLLDFLVFICVEVFIVPSETMVVCISVEPVVIALLSLFYCIYLILLSFLFY